MRPWGAVVVTAIILDPEADTMVIPRLRSATRRLHAWLTGEEYEIRACVAVVETDWMAICPWRMRGRTTSPLKTRRMAVARVCPDSTGRPVWEIAGGEAAGDGLYI
jgi:hypothetical protein